MIFNEVYSIYYRIVSKLIQISLEKNINYKEATEIVKKEGFLESFIYIMDNIKNENWYVFDKNLKTSIKHLPKNSLTILEKRFLKTIVNDPRFKLFYDGEFEELSDYTPLYKNEDFYYFDKVDDGDSFEDINYIENFRSILKALEENRQMDISYENKNNKITRKNLIPIKLEYSQKDDKFRLIATDSKSRFTLNVAQIKNITLLDSFNEPLKDFQVTKEVVTLKIIDKRNALERAMLNFATYEKETKELENNEYEIKLIYNKEDRTEILIRILSFGPMMLVLSPKDFKEEIKNRLLRQQTLNAFK